MSTKIKVSRTSTSGKAHPATTAADYGLLRVNIPDRKVFVVDSLGQPAIVADRIDDFSTAKQYVAGDFCIYLGDLYRAVGVVNGGAWVGTEWLLIGGGGSSGGAILTVPTSATHNTINLDSHPTYKGLVITGSAGQTANLFEAFGKAGDPKGAFIDPLGFPDGRFAPNIFRVLQSGHPFDFVGQPASFAGSLWVLADANVAARTTLAVVEQVIDANNFVLRTGGRITGLDSEAFVATPVAGKVYYASDSAGLLSDTPSVSRPDPVLVTLTTTTAIVVAGGGAGSTAYVSISGDTMTGHLTMAPSQEIRFEDANTSIHKQSTAAGIIFKVSGATAARIDESGTGIPYTTTVMTKEKTDAVYLKLTGGAVTSQLRVPLGSSGTPGLGVGATDTGLYSNGANVLVTIDGSAAARFTPGTTHTDSLDVMTRGKADTRYLLQTGDTMTGFLTLHALPTASMHAATKGYVDTQVGNAMSQTEGDARYALRSLTLTAGTGMNGGGNLTANRTFSLDTAYTDGRYLRLSAGKTVTQSVQGRVNIYSNDANGVAQRWYGTSDNLVGTISTVGSFTVAGTVAATDGGMKMWHSGGAGYLRNENGGDIVFQFGSTSVFTFESDGNLNSDSSVARRAEGDERWGLKVPTGAGGIGTYAFLRDTSNRLIKPGAVITGTTLAYSNGGGVTLHPGFVDSPIRPSGNWMCMGMSTSYNGDAEEMVTLYVRVS